MGIAEGVEPSRHGNPESAGYRRGSKSIKRNLGHPGLAAGLGAQSAFRAGPLADLEREPRRCQTRSRLLSLAHFIPGSGTIRPDSRPTKKPAQKRRPWCGGGVSIKLFVCDPYVLHLYKRFKRPQVLDSVRAVGGAAIVPSCGRTVRWWIDSVSKSLVTA